MTPKRSFILTCAIVIVGWAVGLWVTPTIPPVSAVPTKPQPSKGGDRGARTMVPDIDLAEIMALSKDIEIAGPGQDFKRTPESLERQALVARQISKLTPAQIRSFLTELTNDSGLPIEGKCWFGFLALNAMAESDPGGALDLTVLSADMFKKSRMGPGFASEVVKQVARQNPAMALEKLDKLLAAYSDLNRSSLTSAIATGAASKSPDIAFHLLEGLYGKTEPDQLKGSVSMMSIQITSNEGRLALLNAVRAYLPTVTDERQKRALEMSLFSGLTYKVTGSGFETAQGWIKQASLSAAEQWTLFNCLQQSSIQGDTGRWIEWFDKIPVPESYAGKDDREPRNGKARSLVREWAGEDHVAAEKWLESLPEGDLRSYSVNGYVCAIAAKLPQEAAEWALTLPNEKDRSTMLKTIYDTAEWENDEASETFAKRYGIE